MIIFRYLFKELMLSTSAITLILFIVIMSSRLSRHLGDAASGILDSSVLLWMILYRSPDILQLIIPLSFFLSIMLVFGKLYLEQELIVLISAGFSEFKVLVYTLINAMFIAIIVGVLCFYLTPIGMHKVQNILNEQKNITEFDTIIPGRFQKIRDGSRVTYAEQVSNNKTKLNNIFISEKRFDGNKNPIDGASVLFAESGSVELLNNGDRYLILHNGKRYNGNPGSFAYEMMSFEKYGILLPKPNIEINTSTSNALSFTDIMQSNKIEDRVELAWRASLVLLVIIVTLIATPLSKVKPRQGRFLKLIPAVIIYMFYLSFLISVRSSIVKNNLSIFSLFAVHLLFLLFGLFLIWQDKIKYLLGIK